MYRVLSSLKACHLSHCPSFHHTSTIHNTPSHSIHHGVKPISTMELFPLHCKFYMVSPYSPREPSSYLPSHNRTLTLSLGDGWKRSPNLSKASSIGGFGVLTYTRGCKAQLSRVDKYCSSSRKTSCTHLLIVPDSHCLQTDWELAREHCHLSLIAPCGVSNIETHHSR